MTAKTKQTKVYYLKQLTFIKYNPRKALKNKDFMVSGNIRKSYVPCFTFSTPYSPASRTSQSYIDLLLHNSEYFVLAHHPNRHRFSFHKSKNIRTIPAKIPPKPPQTFPPLKKFSAACKNCGILSLLLMWDIKRRGAVTRHAQCKRPRQAKVSLWRTRLKKASANESVFASFFSMNNGRRRVRRAPPSPPGM